MMYREQCTDIMRDYYEYLYQNKIFVLLRGCYLLTPYLNPSQFSACLYPILLSLLTAWQNTQIHNLFLLPLFICSFLLLYNPSSQILALCPTTHLFFLLLHSFRENPGTIMDSYAMHSSFLLQYWSLLCKMLLILFLLLNGSPYNFFVTCLQFYFL